MKIRKISTHSLDQAQLRHLESELYSGLAKIRQANYALEDIGEVNFIIEDKKKVLHRRGSSGDLVIIGTDVNRFGVCIKSIFLQNKDQVRDRMHRLGKQYISLIGG